jgi:hypothetical protein
MGKITEWIKKSLANPDFLLYVLGFILYCGFSLGNISKYSWLNDLLSNGIEKLGVVIHVGEFHKGRTYNAKIQKDDTIVRFTTYYELSIGDKIPLLVSSDNLSNGRVGSKSSSLFDLYNNGSSGGAISEFFMLGLFIIGHPMVAIELYRIHKIHGKD